MSEPYELGTTPPARRALAERLPLDVAAAAVEFLTGIYSARLGRDWRVLYEIDEARHAVVVLDVRHRSVVYRRR